MNRMTMVCLAGISMGVAHPVSAAYFYSVGSEIYTQSGFAFGDSSFSTLGDPPQTFAELGPTRAIAEVAPGAIFLQNLGTYDTIPPVPPPVVPIGDGYRGARSRGYVSDTLTVDAAVATGFLQVALVYSNTGFTTNGYDITKAGYSSSLYDIYFTFAAGAVDAAETFVDYNRRFGSFAFTDGFGTLIEATTVDLTTGGFASGQVFLVPFTSGELLEVILSGDCTGGSQISGIGRGSGGCASGQTFGWGGILGALDAEGRAIALPTISSSSGADYTRNLTGIAFEPVFGVPEPAVWAQLILGFGLAGVALRSRRAKTT